ncbi:MAG TPA: ribokinase, partial [Candidatus Marinimicrobia bacterium]|nr:ribokinase [Candidatus Neomarinimicrobiota bacterium]
MKSVLVVGSANMDMVVRVDKYPLPGETVFGNQFGMYPGGKGANQAVACAKLGAKTVFVGKMGNDIFHERLVQNMKTNGVNVKDILIDLEAPTGVALIYVDSTGQNEIVVVSGSNMSITPDDVKGKKSLFSRASVVLTQLEIPVETVSAVAELTKQNGAVLILNPAPACKIPEDILNKVDYLTPNETELSLLSGHDVENRESIITASHTLLNKGVKNVIVTQGSKGALHVSKGEWREFPAMAVTTVDTTAAGDAFNGAFAYGLASGNSIPDAIIFANRVAAFSVTRHGAQTSMPTLHDINENKY